jgi:hypothetical protein
MSLSGPNSSAPERGAFIPFPLPVEGPEEDIRSGPCGVLVFNDSWRPYILGALKVLARPETWKSDDPEKIAGWVEQGMHLQSMLPGISGNIGPCNVDWVAIADFVAGFHHIGTLLNPLDEVSGQFYFSYAAINDLGDAGAVSIHFEDFNGNFVGGLVDVRWFSINTNIIPSFWQYDYTDCTGGHHTGSDFTTGGALLNKQMREIAISQTGGLYVTVTLKGKFLCGPA